MSAIKQGEEEYVDDVCKAAALEGFIGLDGVVRFAALMSVELEISADVAICHFRHSSL